MIASGSICKAQLPVSHTVEALPDDQFVVEIGGKEYHAINGDKVIALAKMKEDLATAQKINTELSSQIKEALLERDLAKAQLALVQQKADSFESDFKRARDDAARNFSLFQSERELRVESQAFIPHGNVKGFWGKVLTALDSGPSQAAFKLVIPTATFLRAYTAKCSP